MSVDDHLAEWVLRSDWFVGVHGDVLEESEHRRDARRVNAVLGLFQAEDALGRGVEFHHGEGEEPQGAIRERPGGVLGTVTIPGHQCQEFALGVDIDAEITKIVDEFGEPVGDSGVDVGPLLGSRVVGARAAPGEGIEGGGECAPSAPIRGGVLKSSGFRNAAGSSCRRRQDSISRRTRTAVRFSTPLACESTVRGSVAVGKSRGFPPLSPRS
jgi:hypothetical protein